LLHLFRVMGEDDVSSSPAVRLHRRCSITIDRVFVSRVPSYSSPCSANDGLASPPNEENCFTKFEFYRTDAPDCRKSLCPTLREKKWCSLSRVSCTDINVPSRNGEG